MLKKKIIKIVTAFGIVGTILSGCSRQETHHQGNETGTPKTATAKSSSKQEHSGFLWNKDKATALDSFMKSWGNTMGQQYQSYFPGNNTDYYGLAFPKELGQHSIAVNGNTNVKVAWSNNGRGNADYNVVAIYCDSATAKPMEAHLYLFTIHHGKPVVLVTMTTNGNTLYFHETKNTALQNGFTKIMGNKKEHSVVHRTNKDTPLSLTSQQLGTLVGLYKAPDWFKGGLKGGTMWYGNSQNTPDIGSAFQGFDYITANGDPTSYLYYKQNGGNVVIKYVDPTNSQGVANAPIRTETIPLKRLINDYYNTPQKKQEVDGYANELKPEADFLSQTQGN